MTHFDDEADIRCDDCGRPGYRTDSGVLYMHRVDCATFWPDALRDEVAERRCPTCGSAPKLVKPRRRRPYVRHYHALRCPERPVNASARAEAYT